ncbi:hypothetical protein [Trinickia dinghuensis]|uniref:hypothetical protein n=1 Tax=Trinickia dinghuensis TaxID=2291023 RepID=UPI0011C03E7C|nr:hypothetical protein [Trinickia dinghuensis]
MPAPDGTLLCLFSNEKLLLIDDFYRELKGIYKITDVWPNLATYNTAPSVNMGNNLDAAYYCPEYTQIAFFKADQCAIYNYGSNKWLQGKISDHFSAPTSTGETFYSNLTAASTGVNHVNYAFYSGRNFINGPIANQDPFQVTKVNLSQGPSDIVSNGWNLSSNQDLVASTLVAELTAYGAQGDGKLERCLIVHDTSDGHYKFTFEQNGVPGFTPVKGVMRLTELWPQYSDNEFPIQAATRVDASIVANAKPLPVPVPTPYPYQGPGPVLTPNPLCDELGNIMKSVCSLTLLMHKAIDACYPPSSWPTQPYPDGCSSSGHKRHPCGCKGQPGGTSYGGEPAGGPVGPLGNGPVQ